MTPRHPLPFLALLSLCLLAGCKNGEDAKETYLCPQIVRLDYREPVLTIQSATGTDAAGTAVPNLVLGNFKLDGQPRSAAQAAGSMNGRYGATEKDGTLACTVACGFGTDSGVYEFTVSAPGYQTQTVTARAGYSVMSGINDSAGCNNGTTYDGGTRIQLRLVPQPASS